MFVEGMFVEAFMVIIWHMCLGYMSTRGFNMMSKRVFARYLKGGDFVIL